MRHGAPLRDRWPILTGNDAQWSTSTPLYTLKAEFFKTLGHPARIRILELLAVRDHTVSELAREVGLESSHLSHQLSVLRRTGVVVARKDGNATVYSVASRQITELLAVARTALIGLLSDQADLLRDLRASSRAAARANRR